MLYIVTAVAHNHAPTKRPIGAEFNLDDDQACYYFVDAHGAPRRFPWQHVSERDLNPDIVWAGKRHLAEWSFLLTELDKPFAQYPFFVVSSRFHDKNVRLRSNITTALSIGYALLKRYGYAYLPSYDRDVGFEDLQYYWRVGHLAIRTSGLRLIDELYQVKMVRDYRWFSDFFCNYIGFQSRAHFVRYMEFYRPLLSRFLTAKYEIKSNPEDYVGRMDIYRNEKPLTFLLEMISHLFFYKEDVPFGGVGYDGGYRVDERRTRMRRLYPLQRFATERSGLADLKAAIPFTTPVRHGWSADHMERDMRDAASRGKLRERFDAAKHL